MIWTILVTGLTLALIVKGHTGGGLIHHRCWLGQR
jgi:hypothetical protein